MFDIKSIIVPLLGIIVFAGCHIPRYTGVVITNNNIYLNTPKGNPEQLTSTGRDQSAVYSARKNVVYFVRHQELNASTAVDELPALSIMRMNVKTRKTDQLTDTIRHEDWKSTQKLYLVGGLTLSEDGQYLYFVTEKWETSGVLAKLNTRTAETKEIIDGDGFELIRNGQYRGNLLVVRNDIDGEEGRQSYHWLIAPDGKEIMKIGDDQALKTFRSKFMHQ